MIRLHIATLLGALLYSGAAAQAPSQPPSGTEPQVEFRFENPQLQPASYTLLVHPDGSGHFHAVPGHTPPGDIAALPAQEQDRPIHITKGVADRIFAIAKQKKFFAIPCESGNDSVAFQGKKTLSYQGPDGQGSCTYNYSKDAQIQWLTGELQGTAATLEEGRRLDLEHEHGRLTLDAELETLETLVQNGQATELGNIAPTLQAIIADDQVMEHAQRRARKLLTVSEKGEGAPSPK